MEPDEEFVELESFLKYYLVQSRHTDQIRAAELLGKILGPAFEDVQATLLDAMGKNLGEGQIEKQMQCMAIVNAMTDDGLDLIKGLYAGLQHRERMEKIRGENK